MDHEDKVMKGLGKQKGAGEENGETQAEASLRADDGEADEVVEIPLRHIRCNPRRARRRLGEISFPAATTGMGRRRCLRLGGAGGRVFEGDRRAGGAVPEVYEDDRR